MLTCAPTLRKLAQGNNPSKLMAIFADDLPDTIRVKGTSDVNKVNPAGHWISGQKYTALNMTLELLDVTGNVIRECAYDANGNVTSNCSVLFMSFSAVVSGSTAVINWDVAAEQGISKYQLETSPDTTTFNVAGEQLFDSTKTGSYSKSVTIPAGTVYFRITAVCSGGATIISDLFN